MIYIKSNCYASNWNSKKQMREKELRFKVMMLNVYKYSDNGYLVEEISYNNQ